MNEVGLVSSSVQWLSFSPLSDGALAFHTARGWSGVLDTNRGAITHAYCPPSPDELSTDEERLCEPWMKRARRRRGAWSPSGTHVLCPTPVDLWDFSNNGLSVLDFSPSDRSRCWVRAMRFPMRATPGWC